MEHSTPSALLPLAAAIPPEGSSVVPAASKNLGAIGVHTLLLLAGGIVEREAAAALRGPQTISGLFDTHNQFNSGPLAMQLTISGLRSYDCTSPS